jgi:aryl-alcohol dehydrogenase-like predicted oxidoreductase
MSVRLLNDARHWRDRAAQIRALSDWMSDAQRRARILKLANDYDKLAEQAREGGVSPAQVAPNWLVYQFEVISELH